MVLTLVALPVLELVSRKAKQAQATRCAALVRVVRLRLRARAS